MKKAIKNFTETAKEFVIRTDIAIKGGILSIRKPLQNNDGWGKEEILGIAITLVIAAFVIFPELRDFAKKLAEGMDSWYDTSIKSKIFGTT